MQNGAYYGFFLYTYQIWNSFRHFKFLIYNAAKCSDSVFVIDKLLCNLNWSGTRAIITSASEDHRPLVCQLTLN